MTLGYAVNPPADLGYPDLIGWTIARAHETAKLARMEEAVRWFDLTRTLLRQITPSQTLEAKVAADRAASVREAEKVKAALLGGTDAQAQTRVAIFGDSLGLPRPEEMQDFESAIQSTYSGLILSKLRSAKKLGAVRVESHCQRYFTTSDLVTYLEARPDSVRDAHVLVHLGLNDCSVRMFMVDQRIAIGMLPESIAGEILAFSRTYRRALVEAFPQFSYVPFDRFNSNLQRIASQVRAAGGKSLTFCTIIVLPMKFWGATPGVCKNFTRYNLSIMDNADLVGARVVDVDRLAWQDNIGSSLNADGMHLAAAGHQALASAWTKMIFDV